MKWIKPLILLAAVAGIGWFLWTTLFPSPERVIRKRIAELEKAASFAGNEGELARVSNAGNVAGFFSRDAEILIDVPGFQRQSIAGRDEIFRVATVARTRMNGLDVDFLDVGVTLQPNRQNARVSLTAKANVPGERDFMVQELEFEMVRDGRNWLIRRVLTIRTLN